MAETLETLAGTMPDGHVAEQLGIDAEAVKKWRREHGVAPFRREPPGASRTAAGGDAPATRSRRRIVRRRGDRTSVVAREEPADVAAPVREKPHGGRRSAADAVASFRDRMGKVSDEAIAAEAGVTRGVVGAYRRKHGIPAFEGYLFEAGRAPTGGRRKAASSAPRGRRPAGRSRIDAFADLVGVESDAEVAAKAGVSRTAVTAWRRRHGIGASQPRGMHEAYAGIDGLGAARLAARWVRRSARQGRRC